MASKVFKTRIAIALFTVIVMVLQIQIVSVQAASGGLKITHTYIPSISAPSNSVESDHQIKFDEEVLLADFKVTEYEGKEYKLCRISIVSKTKKGCLCIDVIDYEMFKEIGTHCIEGDIGTGYSIDLKEELKEIITDVYEIMDQDKNIIEGRFEKDPQRIRILVTTSSSRMAPQVEQNSLEIQNCGNLYFSVDEDNVDTQRYLFSENENYTIEFFYEEIPETYKISYDGNEGTGSVVDENEYTQSEVANTKENEFARNGYKFINWNTKSDGTGLAYGEKAEIVVEKNVTLYAQWQKNEDEEKYTISYSGNGGTGSVDDEKQYSTGETATVKENAFTKDGYKFVDWNTVSDGSGISFSEGSSVYVENNVTLYAQWQETVVKNIFRVTYDSNGGIGAVVDDKEYEKGSEAEVKENTFTKSNSKFLNWNTASDGTGIDYNAGDTVIIAGDTTLFAQWKQNDDDPGTWTEPEISETPETPNIPASDETEEYTEFDDNGVPLGTWHKDPDTGEWIFTPAEVPLDDSPATGDSSNAIAFASVIIVALGAVFGLRKNKKNII